MSDRSQPDWRPACSIDMLRIRARSLAIVRSFFDSRGFVEVETPCLSTDFVPDAGIEPFSVSRGAWHGFLQASPECGMKRLLAAGSGSIYQISRAFRGGESGRIHNPEFTMVEWYAVGADWRSQMEVTEQLVRTVCASAAGTGAEPRRVASDLFAADPFAVLSYAEAFRERLGVEVHSASGAELIQCAERHGISLPEGISPCEVDGIRHALLAIGIEPHLGGRQPDGRLRPAFLCDYPATQAALAVLSDDPLPVARRFELYVDGLELCNGYQELSDAAEYRRRELQLLNARSEGSPSRLRGAPRLAAAMEAGLPACSGVALGLDRLLMVATGAGSIQGVIPFASELT